MGNQSHHVYQSRFLRKVYHPHQTPDEGPDS